MSDLFPASANKIDEIFRNAALEYAIAPYYDQTITQVNFENWPIKNINDYLESQLDWETSPYCRISKWFEPELTMPNVSTLTEEERRRVLMETIHKLFEKKIVFCFSDHLSDYEFYQLIARKILPSSEKLMTKRSGYLCWDCSSSDDLDESIENWLVYYASEEERVKWSEVHESPLPQKLYPLYPRDIPLEPAE